MTTNTKFSYASLQLPTQKESWETRNSSCFGRMPTVPIIGQEGLYEQGVDDVQQIHGNVYKDIVKTHPFNWS